MIDRQAAARAIHDFLRAIGRDPEHDADLKDTGRRVADAFIDEVCDGYAVDAKSLLANGVIEGETGVVCVKDLAVSTMCPHHLMPAVGVATVAFEPLHHLVGFGVVGQVVDAFAHRLTLQERIGESVVEQIMTALSPKWAGCRLVLTHGCLTARGERRHGSRVETVALRGVALAEERAAAYRVLGVGA